MDKCFENDSAFMDKAGFERIDSSWKKHVLRSLDPFWTNYYSLLDKADFENVLRFVVIKRFNSPGKGAMVRFTFLAVP